MMTVCVTLQNLFDEDYINSLRNLQAPDVAETLAEGDQLPQYKQVDWIARPVGIDASVA